MQASCRSNLCTGGFGCWSVTNGEVIKKEAEKWKFLSNEKKRPCCLGYRGDEILPSYVGIIMRHYKDPSLSTNQYSGK